MKRTVLHTIAVMSLLMLSSCATIFCGSKKRIMIDANVDSAESITIDGRKYKNVSFPYQTKVKRGFNDTLVTSEKEGYKTSELSIYKNFNAVSVINLLSILGWAIDGASGAMMKPEFNRYELEFETNGEKK